MLIQRILCSAGVALILLGGSPAQAEEPGSEGEGSERNQAHQEAVSMKTEDQVLKEQILKVDSVLQETHQRMTQKRQELQQATDESRKAALYAQLDGLRKERDMLERLLHDLVEEATATEWTAIDEALRRAKSFERYQEKAYQKEENLRERKQ